MVARNKFLNKEDKNRKKVSFSINSNFYGGITKNKKYDSKYNPKYLEKHPRIIELDDIDNINNIKRKDVFDFTTMFDSLNQTKDTNKNKNININGKQHYKRYDYEPFYKNVSTPLTLSLNLNEENLEILLNSNWINYENLVYIPLHLRNLICKVDECNEVTENIETSFYIDSYWLIKFIDIMIAKIVKSYGEEGKSYFFDGEISFDVTKKYFDKSEEENIEQTHIIKHNISLCDWLSSSIIGTFPADKIPIHCAKIFVKHLKHIVDLIENNEQKWIEFAINRINL